MGRVNDGHRRWEGPGERADGLFQCAASITPETRHDTTAASKEIVNQFMGMAQGLIAKLRLEAVPSS